MTCRMAAGQRRKQQTNSNSHKQYSGKKKRKLGPYDLCLRSQVDLEWDVRQKRVVAKKAQVGLTWNYMAAFVDSFTRSHSGIADVVSVPYEIFDLDNLSEVLTYEVWATCLSEPERKLLSQFLPSETDTEHVVHSLLKGENHHFGNPYLKWSSSLCAGNLHPDNVLHLEKQFKFNKRAYYHEINKYHSGMLEVLKNWRERWLSCKDPENLWSEEFTKNKQENLAICAERAKVPNCSKGEMSNNNSVHNSDAIKFMSCIKITRSQFQLVKNLKHSGDGIQSKSLSHVLGDINSFHAHSYVTYEEEEKKRLHEQWLQIARKDLPAAFGVHKGRKLHREQCWKFLEQELAMKRKLILHKDEKTENLESSNQESSYSGDLHEHEHAPDGEGEKNEDVDPRYEAINDHQLENIPSIDPNQKTCFMVANDEAVGEDTLKQEDCVLPLSESLYCQSENIKLEGSLASVKSMWQPRSLADYYCNTSQVHGYLSADQMIPVRHKQVNEEHAAHIIDLKRDVPQLEAGKTVASAFIRESIFYSPANQDCTGVPPTCPEGSGMLSSYTHQHMNSVRQPALHFLMPNDRLTDSGQFASLFVGPAQIQQQREVWEKGPHMHQTVNESAYTAGRYASKRQFPPADQHGFSAMYSSGNSGSIGYNWFPDENQEAYHNWSGVATSSSSHSVAVGKNADGNLFSVFSNRSVCSPLEVLNSEQYIQTRNFDGVEMASAEDTRAYAQTQLHNSGGHEAVGASSLRRGSWINTPHHSLGLHNPGGRPFPRP
ncbi:uncharacterized protein LOC135632697 [Musa acuminata AAA Group]|uniref:uncharacterized protein LOC135632697 n=1 Tax=Musa acuminata AAA Group TaxID=214697 RepID=UPI0031D6F5C0